MAQSHQRSVRTAVLAVMLAGAVMPMVSAGSAEPATAPPPERRYVVRRATGPIQVDGRLNEPDWRRADDVGDFVFPWWTQGRRERTDTRALWDDQYLYIAFRCEDAHISAVVTERNGKVYEDDCVEAFIAANSSRPLDYINFEINALAAMLAGCHRRGQGDPPGWFPQGVKIGRSILGTMNDDSDHDTSWIIEVAIPFAVFDVLGSGQTPKPGDAWRVNFNRCGGVANAQYSQWVSTKTESPNFHVPARFGGLVFSDAPVRSDEGAVRMTFDDDRDIAGDFVSRAGLYPTLSDRKMSFVDGRFGRALLVGGGWPVAAGTWNESGLDCDLVVAVMWGEYREKPQFWGAGRTHGDRGTVALWLKRKTLLRGRIFFQCTSAWGRLEKDLIDIGVDEAGAFGAAVTDTQYRRHEIRSKPGVWRDDEWQHLALVYDRSEGLRLFHNGEPVASSWGTDAWWATMYPGLFSLFVPETAYDELVLLDRPLTDSQVRTLYETNRLPAMGGEPPLSEAARDRLLAAYGLSEQTELPGVAAAGEAERAKMLRLRQVQVDACRDEHIPAWWVMDGRYELAWPHPYTVFTFILGDVDYHGRKVDIVPAAGERVRYLSLEGVLDGVSVLGSSDGRFERSQPVAQVPQDAPQFFGKRIDPALAKALRIPLERSRGRPPGMRGSMRLPLSGPVRIHEITLLDAEEVAFDAAAAAANNADRAWDLAPSVDGDATKLGRYAFALRALKGSRQRRVISAASNASPSKPSRVTVRPLEDLNVFGPLVPEGYAVDAVTLLLRWVPNAPDDVLWLRVRDPANPSRLWSQATLRANFTARASDPRAPDRRAPDLGRGLPPKPTDTTSPAKTTDKEYILAIRFDITDLLVGADERLWVELTSANGGELVCGTPENGAGTGPDFASRLIVHTIEKSKAIKQYAPHALRATTTQYAKMYNYQPWRFTREAVVLGDWKGFGGPWDMIYPPLAVLRHDPENVWANRYRMLTLERSARGQVPTEASPRKVEIDAPAGGAPDWAVWGRELHRLNLKAAHWIAERQVDDGQFWGGWNDDPFIVGGYAALPLIGDEKTGVAWSRFYNGLEAVGIFADGYCDVWPIDPLHITDFISYRGLTVLYALGDPRTFERTLITAGRYAERVAATAADRKAKRLPPITGDRKGPGSAVEQMEFHVHRYEKSYVDWYWGRSPPVQPVELTDRRAWANRVKQRFQSYDDVTLFAYTEARVHTDGQRGPGRDELVAGYLGGTLQRSRSQIDPPTIAVSWSGEADADLARLVTRADERRLDVAFYNFADAPKRVRMRCWRLAKGRYQLKLGSDRNDDGEIDEVTDERTLELRRFATVDLQIPPRIIHALQIRQTEPRDGPADLPDLAVASYDVASKPGGVEITVHNLGSAPASDVTVQLVTGDGALLAAGRIDRIDAPTDLRPKTARLVLNAKQPPTGARIVIDPENRIEEILEDNNQIAAHSLPAR